MRIAVLLMLLCGFLHAADADLKVSVYATAGGIEKLLSTPEGRSRAAAAMHKLGVTRVVLEGRRGDEYVAPAKLKELRGELAKLGFATTGGIATVPGAHFGTRQNGPLGWLNWESEATQKGIETFFRENAAVFDELVLDDFFCTADTSAQSEAARGNRDWGQYRRDLLGGLLDSIVIRPAREVKPGIRLVIKYPQWYDLFHTYGYDPAHSAPKFDAVWVGTEVRNPKTQRMGFVQPTEGYINYRWLNAVSRGKAEAAWFDHIECTAQNFVDQAWQSVLAGAPELMLFNLIDVVEGHPGHALFVRDLPALRETAKRVRGKAAQGVAYYKPPNSEPGDNRYLMDYLAMLGIPVVPAAEYPMDSKTVVLGVQAAHDPALLEKVRAHQKRGGRVAMTASLMDRIQAPPGVVRLDLRTFTDQDFLDAKEFLLSPRELAMMRMPREEADALRKKLGVELSAPVGIAYYRFGNDEAFYSFLDADTEVRLRGKAIKVPAHALHWVKR